MASLIGVLHDQGDQLFSKRWGLMSLWQHIAEHFYPERADFTNARNLGSELMDNLTTSYPVLARRDLGNSLGAMLRPSSKEWFHISTNRPDREDTAAKQYLQWVEGILRGAMQHRGSQFARATKEGDNDFATFGQAVISTEMNKTRNGLLYRCWHLRDVAWLENAEGKVDTIYRNWKPTVTELAALFPKTLHPDTKRLLEKTPYAEVAVRHVVMPAEQYATLPGAKKMRTPYVSIYYEVDKQHELECVGSWTKVYSIPRWQTVSGSQYAHSPAAVAGLPDARTLQAVSLTLLTAGEKSVDPPMIAVQEAIRGDVAIYPGGITWVASEYDERLGEVLRAMSVDKTGLAFGLETQQDIRMQLADAWYLSKLNLPPVTGREMTAYEVGQRVQEFIRNTLPLFEPMEADYNGSLCDDSLELALRNDPRIRGAVPESIQGAEVVFSFTSPLHDAIDKAKVGQFMEAQQIIAQAIQLDRAVGNIVDTTKATRDVLSAVIPAGWMRTEKETEDITTQQQADMQQQQQLASMQQGAEVAKTLSESGLVPKGGVA